jgi:hypothetical protein
MAAAFAAVADKVRITVDVLFSADRLDAAHRAGPDHHRERTSTMADQILFDKLAYIDKLKRAGIDETHARAHGEALDSVLRESVATKSDVETLRHDLQLAVRDLTIRMGGVAIVLFGALVSIKFFG